MFKKYPLCINCSETTNSTVDDNVLSPQRLAATNIMWQQCFWLVSHAPETNRRMPCVSMQWTCEPKNLMALHYETKSHCRLHGCRRYIMFSFCFLQAYCCSRDFHTVAHTLYTVAKNSGHSDCLHRLFVRLFSTDQKKIK